MGTLKRIDFVVALVNAKMLDPADGLWVLNHSAKHPEDFVACLAQVGLEVEGYP